MKQFLMCIVSALLLMVLLTTCAIADTQAEGMAAGTLFVDIRIPETNDTVSAMLRDWVNNVYMPMLAYNGTLNETASGEMRLTFSKEFEGERFIGVVMRGTFGGLDLTESLNIDMETGSFAAPWEIIDFDRVEPVLAMLKDRITEEAPQAEMFLFDMNPSWLTGIYLTDEGLAVPINTKRYLPVIGGDMEFILPFETLGEAFLLAGTADFPPYQKAVAPDLPPVPNTPVPPMPEYFIRNHIPENRPVPEPTPRRPMIALTFDDGPSVFTGMILDILEQHNARATFCVLGNKVKNWENTILRAVAGGNEIIGHSWNHTNMTTQNRASVVDAIRNTDDAIYAVTGTRTPLFRPPFGDINSQLESVAAELGHGILMWSIDPQDWRENHQCPDFIYRWIMNQARDGSVVVLHDIYLSTVQAMEKVIPRLIADGFELVTASELVADHYDDLVPGRIYRGVRIR